MEKKLEQLSNIINSLNSINQTLYTEIEKLSSEKKILLERNRTLEEKQTEVSDSIQKFTAIISVNEERQKEMRILESNLKEKENRLAEDIEYAVKKAESAKDTEKINEINRIKQNYETEIKELKTANNATISQLESEYQEDKKNLNKKINTLTTEKEQLEKKNQDIEQIKTYAEWAKKQEIPNLKNTIEEQEKNIDVKNKEIADLTQKLVLASKSTNNVDNDDLTDGIRAQYKKELGDNEKQIRHLKTAVNNLEASLKESRELRSKAENELKALKNHLINNDHWNSNDVEKVIREGLEKSQNSQINNDPQANRYHEEPYTPNYN